MHYYTRFKNHEHSYQVCEQAQMCILSISDLKNKMYVIVSQDLKLAQSVPVYRAVTEINSQFSVDSLL